MKNVVLKPELRTQGGETVSVYAGDEWVGDVYLVYREGDRMTGTIQIDTGKVEEHELDYVVDEVRTYIEHLNAALGITDSSVVMMYGDISSVVEMEPFDAVDEDDLDVDPEDLPVFSDDEVYEGEDVVIYTEDYDDENDVYVADEYVADAYEDEDDDDYEDSEDDYHLSVVYKSGEHTKYHLHNPDHRTFGMLSVDEIEDNVSGRVEFWDMPDEEETSEVARMLARTFGIGDTEKLSFTMNYEDQHLGDIQLQRRDFM